MKLSKFFDLNSIVIIVGILLFLIVFPELYSDKAILNLGGNIYLCDFFILYIHASVVGIVWYNTSLKGSLYLNKIGFFSLLFYLVLLFGIVKGFYLYGTSAYGMARNFGLYTPLIVLSYYTFRRHSFYQIGGLVKAIAFLAIVFALVKYIYRLTMGLPEPHRAFGTIRTLIISFYFIDLVYKIIRKQVVSYKLYLTALFLFVLILISSQRAIWLSLILLYLIYFIVSNKVNLKTVLISFVSCVLIFVLFLSLPSDNAIKSNITNRFEGIINPKEDISSTTRLITWANALNDFINNPILGKGIGDRSKMNFSQLGQGDQFKYVMPHNYYLAVAAQRGLVGLVPFLILGIIFLVSYIRALKRKSGSHLLFIKINLLSYLVIVFSYRFFWNGQPILWILIGIYLALNENISNNPHIQLRRVYS